MGKSKKEGRIGQKNFSKLWKNLGSEEMTCNCHCCRKIWFFYIVAVIIALLIGIQWVLQFTESRRQVFTDTQTPMQIQTDTIPSQSNIQNRQNEVVSSNVTRGSRNPTVRSINVPDEEVDTIIFEKEIETPPIPPSVVEETPPKG